MHRVLIIDDEKPVRQAIMALGHWDELGVGRVSEAVEGESGLRSLREEPADIVLVDMKMPGMDGAKFLEIARREFPGVKYIVISGYDDFEYTKQAIKAKVLDYLLKPVVEAELNAVLAQAVQEIETERLPLPLSGPAGTEGAAAPTGPPTVAPETLHLQGAEKKYLYEIKDFIDRNYHREIKLSYFAERFYLSKEYLSKLFREEFGFNIYEYVLKVRMEKARELLADPEVRIAAVAEHLGYRDQNYFSRAFKTYYGISPSESRENRKAGFLE